MTIYQILHKGRDLCIPEQFISCVSCAQSLSPDDGATKLQYSVVSLFLSEEQHCFRNRVHELFIISQDEFCILRIKLFFISEELINVSSSGVYPDFSPVDKVLIRSTHVKDNVPPSQIHSYYVLLSSTLSSRQQQHTDEASGLTAVPHYGRFSCSLQLGHHSGRNSGTNYPCRPRSKVKAS